jgi:hypothetical protein
MSPRVASGPHFLGNDDILPLWPRAVDGEHADSGRN